MAPELIPTDVPRITVTSSEVIKSVTIPKIIAINRAVYLWLMRVARERWLNTLDSISMVSCSKSVTTCLEEQDMDENTHSMFGGDGVGGGSDKLLDKVESVARIRRSKYTGCRDLASQNFAS